MENKKLIQINKCHKCPNCKNTYLEFRTGLRFNGYCSERYNFFYCKKCFGEFQDE